jgi:uncharacterized membrane protein YphA (DoxX/SURF4 family)
MKKKTTYWIATVLVACVMTISGALAISHAPPMMKALGHLGYPPYFATLLGIAKLVGVSVFLVPGCAKLKEWVYVGFGITILSAAYSHLSSGDGLMALDPLVIFTALVISYRTRPADRRLNLQPTAWTKSPENGTVVELKEAR